MLLPPRASLFCLLWSGLQEIRVSMASMKTSLFISLGTAILFFGLFAQAGPRDFLFEDAFVCDIDGAFCLKGTLSYESNPRLLHLRARVKKAPGSGLLKISLEGKNRQGYLRFTLLEVRVRGNYSEIINHKMIPDDPDTLTWVVYGVEFDADKDR